MNLIEFTHAENGIESEYKKILESELEMLRVNNVYEHRTRQSLNERFEALHTRQQYLLEDFQAKLTELSLIERALHEIDSNWNNKKYWGEE